MEKTEKSVKEPLIHITKRAGIVWWKGWLIRAAAIVAALVVSALVIVVLTKLNPLKVYESMFDGSFGSSRKLWAMLQKLAMLLIISLAVTPAFKMRF